MAVVYPIFITKEQLEERVGRRTLRRVLDDNRDGNADADATYRVRADASSKVASILAPLGLDDRVGVLFHTATGELVDGVNAPLDPEVIRLTLDVAEAMLAKRHPTVIQKDWVALFEHAEKELKSLRTGMATLLHTEKPHAANHTVHLSSGSRGTECAPTQRFWDDMGDFGR